MSKHEYSEKEVGDMRQRVQYENSLLNIRTGIILTFNGLAAVAIVASDIADVIRIIIWVLVLILNLLWLICFIPSFLGHQ